MICHTGKSCRTLQIPTARYFFHDMLAEVDPESAEKIHENNVKRVIRAS